MKMYKCDICGNQVELIVNGGGELVCCGQPMRKVKANSTDAAGEKHVPVIKREGKKVTVTVGEVLHPMVPEHYIEWVVVEADGKTLRHHFKPGDKPEVEFCVEGDSVVAYEYCNLHGLWTAKL